MIESRITELIIKELKNELGEEQALSPQEKAELAAWLDLSPKNSLWYTEIRNQNNIALSITALERSAIRQDRASGRFQEGMDQLDARMTGRRIGANRYPFVKMVAAAVVLLIIGGAIYYYRGAMRSATGRHDTVNNYTGDDAAPGTNTAILKRANGIHIDLGQVKPGLITQTGKSKVQKIDSTQIAYSTEPFGRNSRGTAVNVEYDTIVTPRGGQYSILLPDGSKVWLNAGSSLRFPTSFTGDSREVTLTGEAYFEIAKQEARPFRVLVENLQVQVLGTRFNIMDYKEEGAIKTTLLDGAVRLDNAASSLVLRPAQQGKVAIDGTGPIAIQKLDNPELPIAWVNGLFEFKHDNITTVMNQLARWYDVEIVYNGKPHMTFTGSLERNNKASDILRVLEASGGVRFKIEGKKIIVLP